MPELPEVETTRRGIEPHILGKKIKVLTIRQHQLRWPVPKNLPSLLQGKKINSVQRRGKYLLLNIGKGTLLIHLGMSGSLRILLKPEPALFHDHIDMELSGNIVLRFNDPRRFGAWLWTDEEPLKHKLLASLGPEPLSDEFTADYLFAKTRKRKAVIKTFIMDSHIVVGVGNIYANEALFASGIRPTRVATKLTRKEAIELVKNIKKILQRSIKQGGTTLRDFVGSDGKPGYFKQQLNVYGRGEESCKTCKKTLKEIRLGQRSTVYCPQCQK